MSNKTIHFSRLAYKTSKIILNGSKRILFRQNGTVIYDSSVHNSHLQSWEEAFGASGIIKRGNIGYKVANIQIVLGINQDAIFGKETENAIIAFQKAHKLKVDGLVGELTKKELWKEGKSILTISGYTR